MIVKQYRYYADPAMALLNQGEDGKNLTADELAKGNFFKGEAEEIRIKTLPGVQFTINETPVLIGDAGEYDILSREGVIIRTIQISKDSITLLQNYPGAAYFIITFIMRPEDTLSKEDSLSKSADTSADSPG